MSDEKTFTLAQAHKHFACNLNGETWTLLDKAERSADDDARMLAAAFGSHYHWLHAGTPVNALRGEWMISRVYAVLGNASEALRHARACVALAEKRGDDYKDFDYVYAKEILARALALNGAKEEAAALRAEAQTLAEQVADEEDRKIVLADLSWGPWGVLSA